MKFTCTLRQIKANLKFVPNSKPAQARDIQLLQEFVDSSSKLLVLTGAGLSTESGIPDYRSDNVGLYARSERRPIMYQEFIRSAEGRQRYWARNFVGWPQFASFQPNDCHGTIAEMENVGKLSWLVTQNVDALHTKAGSRKLTELHGCTHRVVCLHCSSVMKRWELQTIFRKLNPDFNEESMEIAPDGDVLLTEEQVKGFKVPSCEKCGGVLKPDVVFFGDNVRRNIVHKVFDKVEQCDSMLVAGSSLYVYSSYRFVKRACELKKPIAVINIGPTRADSLVDLKLSTRCGEILPKLNIS